jgi:CO dehydrogenase/acetyl-CoA synthase beta subunit
MQNQRLIQRLRDFFNKEYEIGKNLITYQKIPDYNIFFGKSDIGVKLDHFKEVILQEETGLELGGVNKKSFLLVFPVQELESLHDGNITLLGQEIKTIKESSIDFGLFILIGVDKSEIENDELRQLSFISNSIEGFLIRTIPRRFWCRISSDALQRNFSF